MPFRIRVLSPADRDAWVLLRHRLWPKHSLAALAEDADAYLWTRRGNRYRRASMPATVLLAELPSGAIVGFVEVDLRPYVDGCRSSPVGYVEGWYVEPHHRRSHLGRALVRAAEDWAMAQGCSEMGSDTEVENRRSRRAHRAIGYEETGHLVHFRRTLKRAHGVELQGLHPCRSGDP